MVTSRYKQNTRHTQSCKQCRKQKRITIAWSRQLSQRMLYGPYRNISWRKKCGIKTSTKQPFESGNGSTGKPIVLYLMKNSGRNTKGKRKDGKHLQ